MKKIIVANWKMNPSNLSQASELFSSVEKFLKNNSKILKHKEVVICPPFVFIPQLCLQQKTRNLIKIGAQNCFWEEIGPFTGEISPKMLKDFKLEYIILGHSERRLILKEDDQMINKKLQAVLNLKMKPILCVGEKKEDRQKGRTFEVLKKQLTEGLKQISTTFQKSKIFIAYEPVWAIGSGNPCQPVQAKEVLFFLKKFLNSKFSLKFYFLYGGSVNSDNAQNYIKVGFDGLLVGGASLNKEEFLKILQ